MTLTPEKETPTRRARRDSGAPPTPPEGVTAAPQAEETAPPLVTAQQVTRVQQLREDAAEFAALAGRKVRAVAAVVRPVGWVVLASAVVLWIVATTLGWVEVLIAAAVLTAVVLLSLLFLFGRTTYDVELDLTRSHVVVGERAVGALTLTNSTSRGILPSQVVLPVGSGRGLFQVPRLAPGAAHEELFAIPTSARGVLAVGPVSVLRGDPLGLFERTHDRRQAVDLYVHPRTTSLEGLSLGHLRDLEGLPSQHLARDDVSFHALREYQPGDDLRHVHWKSTARVGSVMVRQYEETRRSHFVVGLSTHPDEYRVPDEFELAISVAGSIGLRALRDSRTLDARVQKGALRSQSGRRFLDELSALEHSRPREGGIVALAGAIAAHAPQAAVVVLVTGSKSDTADLRLACSRIPFGVRVLAVVADARVDAPALRRIGEADVLTLGALDQLGGAVRKVLS
ncbi:DUF58 domain-containing protein [uncultured Microbacterium sp.]|uniref:DUF58 domain-containing protein n=1 Tax=uncultured Microbacterium sp. TaxID=191216 RepID=A0A1Y5P320_9MICO|nr:DUF58 domain-containing protein [uncultured Microbacterium sp.]SBS73094.1 conserved hypothetical protein [uncultured Microbacterium sp.]